MGDPDGTIIPSSTCHSCAGRNPVRTKAGIQNKKIMALALATGLLVLLGAGCTMPDQSSKGLSQNQPVISEDPNITAWKDAKLNKLDEDLYSVVIGGRSLLWSPRKDLIGYASPSSEVVFQLDKSQGVPVIKGVEIFTHGDARYSFYDEDTFSLIGIISVQGEGQTNVGAYLNIAAHATCEKDAIAKGESGAGTLIGFAVSSRKDISAPFKLISTIALEKSDKTDVRCLRNEYGDLYIMPNTTTTSIFGRPTMDGGSRNMFLPAGTAVLRLDFSSVSDPMIPKVSLEKAEIKTEPDRADDL